MKIERIETHVCHARMRNWVFVKVITDQPGLYGWGEATPIQAVLDDLYARVLLFRHKANIHILISLDLLVLLH